MSPLWPDFAIARVARETAVEQGLIDHSDKAHAKQRSGRDRRWLGDRQHESVRRPFRRPVPSYAL